MTDETIEAPARGRAHRAHDAPLKTGPLYDPPLPRDGVSKPRLHFGRLKTAAGARNDHFVEVPHGVNLATILVPDYWANVATRLRPMDRIEAFCEDGSWEALLRVMFTTANEARLSVIYAVEHEPGAARAISDVYEVRWKGPGAMWAVVRSDTGAVIKDHLFPQAAAVAYLRDHLMQIKG